MMTARLLQKLGGPRRRIVLLLAVLVVAALAVLFFDTSPSEWPLPGNVLRQEESVRQLRRELADLRKEEGARQRWLITLRHETRSIWHSKAGKMPSVEVQSELEKVAQRAQVSIQNLGAPQTGKLSDNISGIDIPLHIVGSMRDIGRFVAELEKTEPGFSWLSCSIRPDHPRTPHGVILDGRVRALVLSAEGEKSLFGEKGVAP